LEFFFIGDIRTGVTHAQLFIHSHATVRAYGCDVMGWYLDVCSRGMFKEFLSQTTGALSVSTERVGDLNQNFLFALLLHFQILHFGYGIIFLAGWCFEGDPVAAFFGDPVAIENLSISPDSLHH
jgi:hypothetical protein